MSLSRRTFVAGVGVSLAALGVPTVATSESSGQDRYIRQADGSFLDTRSDPRPLEWGEAIEWGVLRDGDDWVVVELHEADVIKALHQAAREQLPPNTRYELRKRIAGNYGRQHGMAWYRLETMDRRPTWGAVPSHPSLVEEGSHYFAGEFVTPGGGEGVVRLATPVPPNAPLPIITGT